MFDFNCCHQPFLLVAECSVAEELAKILILEFKNLHSLPLPHINFDGLLKTRKFDICGKCGVSFCLVFSSTEKRMLW